MCPPRDFSGDPMGRLFDLILRLCAVVAGTIFAATALFISLNVLLRNAYGTTLFGLLDAVEYGLLVATFLGAPWVLWKRAHVMVDLVTGALPSGPARILAQGTALLGCIICLVLCWYALQAAVTSFGRGSMVRTAFVFPEWWVLSVLPVSLVLMAAEFLRQAVFPPDAPRDTAGL